MLKLMISEDEALERKALKMLLEKYYKDFIQVVSEVSNGKEAVEKAKMHNPDIILMDINMPIMDGLEAATLIKENYRDTEFIILTAFNYFDYAKKAIGIGVSDYLLKPFSNKEFCGAMDKLIDKIKTKKSDEDISKKLKSNYKRLIPYIEKEMVTDIVYGASLMEEQYKEYKDILNITQEKYCSIVFSSIDKKVFDESSISTMKNKLNILFPKIVGGLCLNDIVLFVFDENLESIILSKRFESIIETIEKDFKLDKNVKIYTGISYVNEGLDKLYHSYKEAKLAVERKLVEKSTDNKTKFNIEGFNVNNIEVALCGRIINEDLEGATTEIDNILSNLLNSEEGKDFNYVKTSLLDIFKTIIESISEFVGEGANTSNITKSLEELTNMKDILSLKKHSIGLIKDAISFIGSYKRSKNIDVVEKAKKYIEANYMKEITLDEIAQYVSMSTFYFSRIFTKVEGMNFRDYLVKIRMEKAKSLLRQGNKSIKQVALEVGYVDQNYFSKAFKKYTNYSPKEYTNL